MIDHDPEDSTQPPPDYLYHYTTADFAREAVADLAGVGEVKAEIWPGTFGEGFYALDIAADQATQDELRDECFQGDRPEHPMDGVLVVDPSLAETPFQFEPELVDVPRDVPNVVR